MKNAIFVGHGLEDEGVLLNNQLVDWQTFANVANRLQTVKIDFLNCGSDAVKQYIDANKLGITFNGAIDAKSAALIVSLVINLNNKKIDHVKNILSVISNHLIYIKDNLDKIHFLGVQQVNVWRDNVRITPSIIGSFLLDKLFDITVGIISYVLSGGLEAGPVGVAVAVVLWAVFFSLDTLLDLWSAYTTWVFFTNTVGLNDWGYYDFFIDYSTTSGFAWQTFLGVKIGAIGSISTYIDIWDSDRTYKIATVRQENTMAASISGLFYSVDLGATIIDWDLIDGPYTPPTEDICPYYPYC